MDIYNAVYIKDTKERREKGFREVWKAAQPAAQPCVYQPTVFLPVCRTPRFDPPRAPFLSIGSPMCPLTPSSHANHARFSACWLSYETPREHGALRDGRGNKDSVAVNSTSRRALNIVYVAPAASAGRRRGAASLLYAFLFFFSSSIQLVFGEITVASCSPHLPHFLRHTTEPPPAYFHSLRLFFFSSSAFSFTGLDTGQKTSQIIFLPRVL